MYCCGVHAFSGIVVVGGCQCSSACRVCNSAPTKRIPREKRREPSTRKKKKIDVLLVSLFTVRAPLCERLSQARDGFQALPMWFDVKTESIDA